MREIRLPGRKSVATASITERGIRQKDDLVTLTNEAALDFCRN